MAERPDQTPGPGSGQCPLRHALFPNLEKGSQNDLCPLIINKGTISKGRVELLNLFDVNFKDTLAKTFHEKLFISVGTSKGQTLGGIPCFRSSFHSE